MDYTITHPISTENPILSILCPTTPDRAPFLEKLTSILRKQDNGTFEFIVCEDSKVLTTGAKRNILLDQAKGHWIVFVDDDDEVTPDYISAISPGLVDGYDTVALQLNYYHNGKFSGVAIHSLKYDKWSEDRSKREYYRCPNHLNPVRREIAVAVRFPDKTIGEDSDYSIRMRPYLKSEYDPGRPIYNYFHRTKG